MAANCLFSDYEMNDDAKRLVTDGNASPSSAEALEILVDDLRCDHGSAVNAVLYYGSCLRSDNPFEGIVDLYLITDSYRAIYPGKIRAIWNWLLPPNVFYKELEARDRPLRVKYNILSTASLKRGLSGRRLHSYFWGRFAQPMQVLWSRDEQIRSDIESCLEDAVKTFLNSVLPNVPATGTVADLWAQGLV